MSKTIDVPLPRAILWLGRISFSLYLTHLTTQRLLAHYALKAGIDVHSWSFVFLASCASIFVAYFFYEIVEVRLRNTIRAALDMHSRTRLPVEDAADARKT